MFASAFIAANNYGCNVYGGGTYGASCETTTSDAGGNSANGILSLTGANIFALLIIGLLLIFAGLTIRRLSRKRRTQVA